MLVFMIVHSRFKKMVCGEGRVGGGGGVVVVDVLVVGWGHC